MFDDTDTAYLRSFGTVSTVVPHEGHPDGTMPLTYTIPNHRGIAKIEQALARFTPTPQRGAYAHLYRVVPAVFKQPLLAKLLPAELLGFCYDFFGRARSPLDLLQRMAAQPANPGNEEASGSTPSSASTSSSPDSSLETRSRSTASSSSSAAPPPETRAPVSD